MVFDYKGADIITPIKYIGFKFEKFLPGSVIFLAGEITHPACAGRPSLQLRWKEGQEIISIIPCLLSFVHFQSLSFRRRRREGGQAKRCQGESIAAKLIEQSTHPACASLVDPLFSFARKRVRK
jgi:hypothetical protein